MYSSKVEMSQGKTEQVQERAGPSGAKEATSTDQLSQLMASIQKSQARFENQQLLVCKEEVRQGQEDAATKALKKVRHEKPYQFRRKGNEEQASFNTRIDKALSEAQLDLPGPGTSLALKHAHKATRVKSFSVKNLGMQGWR